jgi:DNA-binding NtrC family response regulator
MRTVIKYTGIVDWQHTERHRPGEAIELDESKLRTRLKALLDACQEANAASDPRPMLGLVTREVAGLSALLEPRQIVGESRQIRGVREVIENIRASSASVLITGEPGTGKELVASTIHHSSLRGRGPLVSWPCGEAGSRVAELFRRARGGSLLLLGVCDLAPAAQGEILHRLDDPETDIRLLATSARDLEALTARGAFRRDLYYRLKVIHIALAPLRETLEDIPLLAGHFLARFCAEFKREPVEFPPELARDLTRRSWPGNIAQLEAEVRLLVRGSLKQTVERLEKQMLEEALEAAHSNQCQAAKALGLSRQGLINKMKRYGL